MSLLVRWRLRAGICPAFEKEYIRRDGARVPVLIGATVLDQEPLRWIAYIVDLTERKMRAEGLVS